MKFFPDRLLATAACNSREGKHCWKRLGGYAGILQADGYDGYYKLYLGGRKPEPIKEAAC